MSCCVVKVFVILFYRNQSQYCFIEVWRGRRRKYIIYKNETIKISKWFDIYSFYWILANCLNKGYKKVYIYHCPCRALWWILGMISWRNLLYKSYTTTRLMFDIINLIDKIGWDNVYILEYPKEEWLNHKKFIDKILKKVPEFRFKLEEIRGKS